jgi:MFS family permease
MVSEKPPTEDGVREAAGEATPYSTFSLWQKRWIVFLAALFSPMSSFIFYPAIHSIAENLHVTVGLTNLAITTYMVVSGVVPALLGNAADKVGRRPIYLLSLSIYLVVNLGLALHHTYTGLLVLRAIQSVGSSGVLSVSTSYMGPVLTRKCSPGTMSLGYGTLSDITIRAERGSYVCVLLLG